MNSTKINMKNDVIKVNTYNFLIDNSIVHVKVDDSFLRTIKEKIIQKYGSLKQFNLQKLRICYTTLEHEFGINEYFKLIRLLKIIQDVSIPKEELFNHISAFFARGSHTRRELVLSKELIIDEEFVESYALYFAEGDNGSNGYTKPRKVRFTNSELSVLKHFKNWLIKYFPGNSYYFKVLIPYNKVFTKEHYNYIKDYFDLDDSRIKTQICKWKKRTGFVYRICCDQAILIDLILALESIIKEICRDNKKLAAAYIRGMMIGEGTAYFNKSRYVRIEMRNEKEIKYLAGLLKFLGYEYKINLRTTRENMWSIYIGAKQLRKFCDEIGFGVHEKRQEILEKAVNKKLRVNQYC
ncbi:MAG: hypothetical protein UR15_C0028G0003 [Parcubacteria group bacterium GW2011_GWA2_31_28]|nr:MAG: hypothetical protein UR15_C0028G0003 [Parcubacteria group bacterium GW2011_GWA2_31_28]